MKIERAVLKVTLRAGGRTWRAGRAFIAPDIPTCILQEIRNNTGTVEVQGVSEKAETVTVDIPDTPDTPSSIDGEKMVAPPASAEEIVSEPEVEPEITVTVNDDIISGPDTVIGKVVEEEEEEEEEEEKPVPKKVKKVSSKVVKRSQRKK